MSSQSEDLSDEPPTAINPYAVLGVEKIATADQIKSAYRKAALKHHPDKAQPEDKDTAHQKFQEIAFAYAILSDARRRSRYDTTGRTEESLDLDDDDFNWTDFFRAQFKEIVTSSAIAKFKDEYKSSTEEKEALLRAYEDGEGDMERVYEEVILSNPLEDEERFRRIIDAEIKAGNVKSHKKYTSESKASRKRRLDNARKEECEALEMARELGVEEQLFGNGTKANSKPKSKRGVKGKKAAADEDEDNSALAALIQQRQKGRQADFLADLEAKYAAKGRKGSRRNAEDEPPEEAFQATAARAKKNKTRN